LERPEERAIRSSLILYYLKEREAWLLHLNGYSQANIYYVSRHKERKK